MGRIITIDGPAGAGKGSVARALASALGFQFLDTGALYRAVTLAALEAGVSPDDEGALGVLAESLDLAFDENGHTKLCGRDVSRAIREQAVTDMVSRVSAQAAVREALMGLQRRMAEEGDLVCEGRDMGTVVFPDADLKIYLDADSRTRAGRRLKQVQERGEEGELESVESEIRARDHQDRVRAHAPLRRDPSQIHVDTSQLAFQDVLERLLGLARDCFLDQDKAGA